MIEATIGGQRDALAAKKISAVETVTALFAQADKRKHLNVYITEARDAAMAEARDADARIAKGEARPLEGVAVAVKDNYCTMGLRTTAGSKMLANFIPPYESTVTRKLRAAGAIMLGKVNMDEFAMGSSTESSFFGPTLNPVGDDLGLGALAPGGSSGGSAAAVAAHFAHAALGSDTGGSIRQPAAFCGVVGFKPTYGVCSRWGIVAYASSLDQAGPITKSVADAALMMDAIAGHDPMDSTSIPRDDYAFHHALKGEPRKLRIGFPREYRASGSTAVTEKIWALAERAAKDIGAEIVDVSIPTAKYSLPAYYIIALSEASSNLARYDGVKYGHRAAHFTDITDMYEKTRAEGFGREVKRRIMLGTFALSAGYYDAYYARAQRVRKKIATEFDAAFESVDFIAMPTAPTSAFPIGAHKASPVEMYLEDIFTVPVNMAGLPGLSLPIGKDANGMPLGLQLVGKTFADEDLLLAGQRVEAAVRAWG